MLIISSARLISLVLIEEGLEGFRAMSGRSVLLLAEFFVGNEAGQNSVSSKTVNSHENGTNTISTDEDNLR